jgi:hypothetical protein
MKDSFLRTLMNKLKGQHQANRKSGVYGYMWWSGLKIILLYFAIFIPIILIAKYLIDLNPFFKYVFEHFSDFTVLGIFLISESLLGLIPPDFFIIWTSKFNSPLIFLTLLGILSYAGGIISYYIGTLLLKTPRIKSYSERVFQKYIVLVRKWGGAFIVISALFPFSPFSMIVMAVSLFKYPFRLMLLFGLSRIARFIIQGVFYLNILRMDDFFASLF